MFLNQPKNYKRQTKSSFWFRRVSLVALLLVIFGYSFIPHPYHVSYTTINYSDENQKVDVNIELFTHDLEVELARHLRWDSTLLINDSTLNDEIEKYIQKYIASTIELEFDSEKQRDFSFSDIGFIEDRIRIQFTIPTEKSLNNLLLRNTLLLGSFSESQQNIVEVNLNGSTEKSLFSVSHTMEFWEIP